MTVTIELSPEVEAGFATLAAAQGIPLSQYLQRFLKEQMPAKRELSKAERIALLEDVHDLPVTPLLSDEAISRESMYGPRG